MESEGTAELGQEIQSLVTSLSQQRGLDWRDLPATATARPRAGSHSLDGTGGMFV